MTTVITTLTDLEHELAALGDLGDVPNTYNAQADYARRESALRGRIRTIRTATDTLEEVEPQIAELTAWHDLLNETIRPTLCEELFALPSPIRTDRDRGSLANLTFSIQVCDRGRAMLDDTGFALETLRLGQLMRDAGIVEAPPTDGRVIGTLPWLGALPEIERRLRELEARRADALARLDAALTD